VTEPVLQNHVLSFKYRLLATRKQHERLAAILEDQRQLYNTALECRIDCYRKTGKTLSHFDMCKQLTQLRRDDYYSQLPANLQRATLNREKTGSSEAAEAARHDPMGFYNSISVKSGGGACVLIPAPAKGALGLLLVSCPPQFHCQTMRPRRRMAGMHHALILASRIMAGGVAGLAFYFAFFLYENEEGVWQNRIENLWASVYDRAKVTDSTSVALFNKLADKLNSMFNHKFGTTLLSIRAFAASFNLSTGIMSLFLLIGMILVIKGPGPKEFLGFIYGLTAAFAVICFASFFFFFMPHQSTTPAPLRPLLPLIPFALSVVGATCLLIIDPGETSLMRLQPIVLALSFLSDYLAIMMMRKIFTSISQTVSILRCVKLIAAFFLFPLLIDVFAPLAYAFGIWNDTMSRDPRYFVIEFVLLNISTVLLCLVPASMLVVVLIHKLIWPLLSRLLYPVASRKVITNRKALVSVGSLCVLYALNPLQVGIKDILKVVS
jgi:hypothetical protein